MLLVAASIQSNLKSDYFKLHKCWSAGLIQPGPEDMRRSEVTGQQWQCFMFWFNLGLAQGQGYLPSA